MRAIIALFALAMLTGCATQAPSHSEPGVHGDAPAGLRPLRFDLRGPVEAGWPAIAGEPAIASDPRGRLFVTDLSCGSSPDRLVGFAAAEAGVNTVAPSAAPRFCDHNPVYRSDDEGRTWKLLNQNGTGKLSPDAPTSGNEGPDIAIDAAGTIIVAGLGCHVGSPQDFAANMSSCQDSYAVVERTLDAGATWSYVPNVVPTTDSPDRLWAVGADPGHIVFAWWQTDTTTSHPSALGTAVTRDGGKTVSVSYIRDKIGWLGRPALTRDGKMAFEPFTVSEERSSRASRRTIELHVGASADGGTSWNDIDTGVRVTAVPTGFPDGLGRAPTLTLTEAGDLVFVYTEQIPDPSGGSNMAAAIKEIHSSDQGKTWSTPLQVSRTPSGILPWAQGARGNDAYITYLADDLPGDPSTSGQWDVRAALLNVTTGQVADTIVDAGVHTGGLCYSTVPCELAFREYFQNTLLPDGRLAIAYPADPIGTKGAVEIRVAVEAGP